jgi:myo-inositol 2-dehydrogenase / D-chiro-inositol 1-dehydrogenase
MSVRVGMVGAGGIARAHLKALAAMPDVQVVGVCDIDRRLAREVAQPLSASVFSSHRLMLEELAPEALYVCVPPYAHGDIEMSAVELGISLFVEKPIGLQMERTAAIADAIDQADLVSCVGYQWRYSDLLDTLCRRMPPGQVHLATGRYLCAMPAVPWWRKRDLSGGQVVEQTTHVFDLLRCLCGEIRRVFAVPLTGVLTDRVDGHTIEDASCVTLEFASGAIGTVTSADFVEVEPACTIELHGDDAIARLSGWMARLEMIEPGRRTTIEAASDPRAELCRAFIRAVRTGDRSLIRSDYRDALQTLAVTLAVNHSMDTGRPVLMSRFTKQDPA